MKAGASKARTLRLATVLPVFVVGPELPPVSYQLGTSRDDRSYKNVPWNGQGVSRT